MESETPSPPAVKPHDAENTEVNTPPVPARFPEAKRRVALLDGVRIFNAYTGGCFRNGKPYQLMTELRKKLMKTRHLGGYSWEHIDEISREWMRWQTNFKISRERHGRSTIIVIRQIPRPLVLTTAEVRRRLVGAIRNHVARYRTAHVDRKFLENFHRLYGLPPEQIVDAWRKIAWIEGHRLRWKGSGRGENLWVEREAQKNTSGPCGQKNGAVSLRQKARGISSPYGGERNENRTALPPIYPDRSTDSLRSPPAGPGFAPSDTPQRPGSSPGGGFSEPSGMPGGVGYAPGMLGNDPANHRWRPAAKPLHVCDRWIAPRRMTRKVCWLVSNPIQAMHAEFFRVRWSKGHAWNFVRSALEAGHLDADICAAWRAGLAETHAAAERDFERSEEQRDRTGIAGDDAAGLREPSQTVARAWLRLRADERTDEQRWSAIFAGSATPQKNFEPQRREGTKPIESPDSVRSVSSVVKNSGQEFRQISPGLRVRADDWTAKQRAAAKLPRTTPALERAHAKEHTTFENYLAHRRLTLGDVLKFNRAEQQKFVREMHAWQSGGSSQKK